MGEKVEIEGKVNISGKGCSGSRCERQQGEMRVGGTLNRRAGVTDCPFLTTVPFSQQSLSPNLQVHGSGPSCGDGPR